MKKHEAAVEAFYSHGAESRAKEADGFLSFGYWNHDTRDYVEATENLLDFVLAEADVRDPGVMLNVCCGNGAETTRIYRRLKPERIHGIDITRSHIEVCQRRAAAQGLSDKLIFQHGDACRTGFAAETFSHIIGIEGPAHFNTREAFFRESSRVLEPGGMLVLTDSILRTASMGPLEDATARLCLRLWHMPPENGVDIGEYRRQLERSGFAVESIRSIGHKVFPGFASHNLRPEAIRNTVQVRGMGIGLGLVFLSWLLGYAYARGVSDYLFVKAIKRG